MRKSNPADAPDFLCIALHSDTLPIQPLPNTPKVLAHRYPCCRGGARVGCLGAKPYAVRIQADPDKLVAHDLGLDELATVIANNNE